MKKILSLLLGIILAYSCSTNNDENVPLPIEPTNLIGNSVSSTQINLYWTDNSTNENGFKIERRIESGTYAVVGNVNADILTFSDVGLTPNTTYIYRVYSYNAAGNSLTYSNETTISTAIPIVTTTLASGITTNSVVSGGTVITDDGSIAISKGVVWSTSTNPTIALTTRTDVGGGSNDTFTSDVTGLLPSTTYYLRAYATNSTGTGYGNEISFTTLAPLAPATPVTDIDGNVYQTVAIGNQVWTKANLNVSRYRNGDIIPEVTDAATWQTLTTGAWCYYQNDTANGPEYGKLYNWYAVNDPRGLAPAGYHIPSDSEWTTLTNYLGGIPVAGGALKESGTTHWNSPNIGATNSSNFTALPGGRRENGSFDTIGNYGFWWSSTDAGGITAYEFNLYYYLGSTNRNNFDKHNGFSVRCVRN
jgi:uncharacterized protein (TIGR02145 family)